MNFEGVLAEWHAVVASRNVAGLDSLIADDAVFWSPALHKPQHGKSLVITYLTAALSVLNNGSFRYVDEWTADDSAVLEFECTIDGTSVDGVDIVRWNADGKIVFFKVMLRPMRALTTVMESMRERLAALA